MYIGIDLGGTSLKYGVVNTNGKIICSSSLKVDNDWKQEEMLSNLGNAINEFLLINNINKKNIIGVGIGSPGAINSTTGYCDSSNNLKMNNCPVCEILSNILNLPTKITNDANAATLAEVRFGVGKGVKNAIMLTLGTGVGGGIIINGQLYEGNQGKGAELGHMVIRLNGRSCLCGRRGCFERYASATALIKDTKHLMTKYKKSSLWSIIRNDLKLLNGYMIFEEAKKGDECANKAIDTYVGFLSEGILNYCNIFRPELVILGGGLSNSKDFLSDKVKEVCKRGLYGFPGTPIVDIKCASLGNDAGIIGAACLFIN